MRKTVNRCPREFPDSEVLRAQWTPSVSHSLKHCLCRTPILVAGVCVVLTVGAHSQVGTYSTTSKGQGKIERDVVAEEAESSNPEEREARRAKNTRYNTGRSDLTLERSQNSEIFFEQVWPAVEFIPVGDSAVVVVGRVIKVQPYLSTDRSRIYTEITVAVDDLIKRDEDSRVAANKTVVIDRLGGALELKTGRIVRDDIQIDNLGHLQFDKRYVVFARATNDGNDLSLIKSYELADGKVFTNDSRPRRLISTLQSVALTWDDEATFVKAVREATAAPARNATRRRRKSA